jgi:two-component system cell cycle response regulator
MKVSEPVSSEANTSRRVLIVDDNQTSTVILKDILEAEGYEAMNALDGAEGLRMVSEYAPAVVLLDLIMPGMGGMEVCRRIRDMELPTRPSVIIVSVRNGEEVVVEALANGADDYIVKPFNEHELMARVRAQIRISDFYKELEEDKRKLETILEISNAVSASLDPSEVLNTIVNKVADLTHAIRCSIVLVSRDDEGYVLASNDNPTVNGLRLDLNKYPEIKQVISTKSPFIVNDLINDPCMSGVKDQIVALKGMSVLIVPIVFNDEVLGTLFLRTRKRADGFNDKEVNFCRIVANSSYRAIKNARLYDQVMKEKDYLKEIAIRDQLTSLYNHNFFYERLEEEFERAVRYETPLSLIMLDIDNFKLINDTYGHRVGDLVLKEISAVICKGVRKTDVVARYGGEEFAVILPHTMLKGAVEEGERLREMIASHAYAGLVQDRITVSVGVAAYPQKGAMNSGDLVNFADDALYKAKWAGKNRVKVAEV